MLILSFDFTFHVLVSCRDVVLRTKMALLHLNVRFTNIPNSFLSQNTFIPFLAQIPTRHIKVLIQTQPKAMFCRWVPQSERYITIQVCMSGALNVEIYKYIAAHCDDCGSKPNFLYCKFETGKVILFGW